MPALKINCFRSRVMKLHELMDIIREIEHWLAFIIEGVFLHRVVHNLAKNHIRVGPPGE